MSQTQNSIAGFFSWWKQGLMEPLEKLWPIDAPTVLTSVESDLGDLQGNILSDIDQQNLKGRNDIFLLVPPEKVMSKRITESLRSLPPVSIAEQVLPFDASEMLVAFDGEEDKICAVLKSELLSEASLLQKRGIVAQGVAFANDSGLIFSIGCIDQDHQSVEPASFKPMPRKGLKFLHGLILVGVATFVVAASFASRIESERHERLGLEFDQVQTKLTLAQSQIQNSFEESVEIRDANHALSILDAIANSLTESTVLDQLILLEDEVIVDAAAQSATKVQSKLNESEVFLSSEFVRSISRSADGGAERFRLKAEIESGELK